MATVNVVPNNLGPTLLIAVGIVTVPAGVGVLAVLTGLALLRQANGQYAFPRLSRWVGRTS